jgi:hypothetical protein
MCSAKASQLLRRAGALLVELRSHLKLILHNKKAAALLCYSCFFIMAVTEGFTQSLVAFSCKLRFVNLAFELRSHPETSCHQFFKAALLSYGLKKSVAVCWLHRSLLVIKWHKGNCGSQNPYFAVMNTTLGIVFLTAKTRPSNRYLL